MPGWCLRPLRLRAERQSRPKDGRVVRRLLEQDGTDPASGCQRHRGTDHDAGNREAEPLIYDDSQPPAVLHVTSPRPYPATLPPLEYPGHFLVKRVTHAGTFRLKHKLLFIANALQTHHIGLEEIDDGIWSIYLGAVLLARVDEREFVIRD